MNYEDEIMRRNEILMKPQSGGRITAGDRLWLATHCIYNRVWGYPYLNADIIRMLPNVRYSVKVKIESIAYCGRILPVFTTPAGCGQMIPCGDVVDSKGRINTNKPVKMLGITTDVLRETRFVYSSDLGVLGVSFECEYYDTLQKLIIRKNSSTGDSNYSMRCDYLQNNMIRYSCKAPGENDFDSLVFSVEWSPEG